MILLRDLAKTEIEQKSRESRMRFSKMSKKPYKKTTFLEI